MDFRAEATVEAAKALVEAQIVMEIFKRGPSGPEGFVENRRIVLLAAEKAWTTIRAMWQTYEWEGLDAAIMLGFRRAVETRQDMDAEDQDWSCNRLVQKFVDEFKPSSLSEATPPGDH